MKLSVIHHVAIIVSDYEVSKDFYVNKLGFSVIRENYRPQKDDWKLDLRVNDTTELEIFGVKNPPERVTNPEAAGLRHRLFVPPISRRMWQSWRKKEYWWNRSGWMHFPTGGLRFLPIRMGCL